MSNYFSYLLIDTALIDAAHPIHTLKGKQSVKWFKTLYERSARSVSPIVVDIEGAIRSNRVELMMSAANLGSRNIGLSLIESSLSLEEVAVHLRQFIYFVDQDGVEFTLRVADCAVLLAMSQTLTAVQWSALMSPFLRWRVFDRERELDDLPRAVTETIAQPPLMLTKAQVAQLQCAAEPDRLLANLSAMRPTILDGWRPLDAHRVATKIIEIWNESENKDHSTLLIFARAVFDSGARLLQHTDAVEYLKESDQAAVRRSIQQRLEKYS